MKSNQKKLQLEELRVNSFVTSQEMDENTLKGGLDSSNACATTVDITLSIINSIIVSHGTIHTLSVRLTVCPGV